MFEIIGLVVATCVFLFWGVTCGAIYGVGVWFFLKRQKQRRLLTGIAASIPIICVLYLMVCIGWIAAFVPEQSDILFGDISEPLPNGYTLTALGKMPDYGQITATGGPISGLTAYFGQIQVDGSMVYGAYSHTFTSDADASQYFALNTENGKIENFNSMTELEKAAGRPVHLVPNANFQSKEPTRIRLLHKEHLIAFMPPLIFLFAYSGFLVIVRTKSGWLKQDLA